MNYETLVDILEKNRTVDRAITYVLGENEERRVSFAEVHARALGILHHLQAMGAGEFLLLQKQRRERAQLGLVLQRQCRQKGVALQRRQPQLCRNLGDGRHGGAHPAGDTGQQVQGGGHAAT